jgi:hypothetical protein
MRFHITCRNSLLDLPYLEEVIGDVIDIPGMPPNSCAVHAVVNAGPTAPLYAVSHIESGKRVAGGDSIDFAIRLAREGVAKMAPDVVAQTLREAIAFRRQVECAGKEVA